MAKVRMQEKRKFQFEHTFTQIKPKLSNPNPETTIAAWFIATHPNVPLSNDNFKSEDSLDSYLGLNEEPESLRSEHREPEFLMHRPCQHRRAAGPQRQQQAPTVVPTQRIAAMATHYPTSYLGSEYLAGQTQKQASTMAYWHSNFSHQTQTGHRYPGERNLRASVEGFNAREYKENVHSFKFPSSMGETSKNPQSTPPSRSEEMQFMKDKSGVSSNGWVTYEYEYDRERITKDKHRFAPMKYSDPQGYHPCLHSKRVSSMLYKRDPALLHI